MKAGAGSVAAFALSRAVYDAQKLFRSGTHADLLSRHPRSTDLRANVQLRSDRDVMLYALGIGLGADPMDSRRAQVCLRARPQGRPDARPRFWGLPRGAPEPALADARRATGRARSTTSWWFTASRRSSCIGRCRPRGTFTTEGRTIGALRQGRGQGRRDYPRDGVDRREPAQKVATLTGSTFARGDGGFGGPSDGAPVAASHAGSRKPDLSLDFRYPARTRPCSTG